MNSTDIYNLMLEKCPNRDRNIHYLQRYVKFIFQCRENNKIIKDGSYMENHHILPKSKNFWSEYSSFKNYPWNKVRLTGKQHFIAHWMLAKAFGGAMWCALSMFKKKPPHINLQIKITGRFYEKIRKEAAVHLGNIRRKNRPPKGKEILLAYTINENHKITKRLKNIRWLNDGKYEIMTDMINIPPDCYEGRIDKIKEINRHNSRNRKDSIWINNSKNERMIVGGNIPNGWVEGRLPCINRNAPDMKGHKNPSYGKRWFTDGTTSVLVLPNDAPEGFIEGVDEVKKKNTTDRQKGNSIYNNGTIEIRLMSGTEVPEGFVKGRVKYKCKYCDMIATKNNLQKYHNDNCRLKSES